MRKCDPLDSVAGPVSARVTLALRSLLRYSPPHGKLMSYKKSKKPLRPLAKHLLFGIPTNIAVGPLGFRAELGVNPQGEPNYPHRGLRVDRPDSTVSLDEKNPDPPRIVFHKRESEVQGPPVPGASTAVAIPDIELNDHPTSEGFKPSPSQSMLTPIYVFAR